jgi:pimeloyl-ACP methyl ester carboxylesterase
MDPQCHLAGLTPPAPRPTRRDSAAAARYTDAMTDSGVDRQSAVVARVEGAGRRHVTPCGAGHLVWRAWGAGPTLVLLHGASGSWLHWIRNVTALARRFRVLVPDLPGFGDSADPAPPADADTLAAALVAGLEAVTPPSETLDIAGFSFGGIIGGLVAARLRRRVRTLVLVGPNGMALPVGELPPLRRVTPDMAPATAREAHRENLRRLMFARAESADDLAVHAQMESLRRARFKSGSIPASDTLLRALPAVTARIAGIWGERDAFAAPYLDERRRALAAFAPDLDFRVIPEAGHWVPYEAAEAVNAALLEILGAERRGAAR